MDCVDTQEGGARSIDCFILFAWQTGDLMWLVSRRSVSDDARRDCYRWRDSDTSQSLATLSAVYLSFCGSISFSGVNTSVLLKSLALQYKAVPLHGFR